MDHARILIGREVVGYFVMNNPFLYLGYQDLSVYRGLQSRDQQSVIASCICPVPSAGGISAQTVGNKPFFGKIIAQLFVGLLGYWVIGLLSYLLMVNGFKFENS